MVEGRRGMIWRVREACMNMTPSMNWRFFDMAAWMISCASWVVAATGFSRSTCFPLAMASRAHCFLGTVGRGR